MLKKVFYILFFCFIHFSPVIADTHTLPKKEIIHIYYLHEIQPTLFMYADILSRPKDELKIVFNGNIPKDNDFNVIPLKMRLETETQIQNGILYKQSDVNDFKKIYNQHKKSDFILHSGIFMSINRLIPFLKQIPKKNIKGIHLYESNRGRLKEFWKPQNFIFDKKELEICIKRHCIQHQDLLFSLGLLYPTTYHIGYIDDLRKNQKYDSFWNKTSQTKAVFEEMDFYQLKEKLTPLQKKELLKIYAIDIDKYLSEIQNKKVNIFVVGHASENNYQNEVIQAITDWYNKYKNDSEYKLYIKWGRNKKLKTELQEQGIFIPDFPDISFELLIIADLIPDLVSGSPTSLFYNLPKEKIGWIYNLPYKHQINFLLENKLITKDQVIDIPLGSSYK